MIALILKQYLYVFRSYFICGDIMTDKISDEVKKYRKPEHDIMPVIVNRWSRRALSGDVADDELMALFEAARWAPSSSNGQPWRFIYAKKGTDAWNKLFSTLSEGNQIWCKNASVLVLIVSRSRYEYKEKPYKTHSFDTGSAWENLALEATNRGLVAHAMGGFDYDKAREVMEVPEPFEVQAMVVIGRRGDKKDLPENLREREIPSTRKPLEEIVFKDKFGGKL